MSSRRAKNSARMPAFQAPTPYHRVHASLKDWWERTHPSRKELEAALQWVQAWMQARTHPPYKSEPQCPSPIKTKLAAQLSRDDWSCLQDQLRRWIVEVTVETDSEDEDEDVEDSPNRCVECGRDLGWSNPRQLCRKTYCEVAERRANLHESSTF